VGKGKGRRGEHLGLLGKALSLDQGVVQLRVSITDLLLVYKQLEAFRHPRK
jgi:hypothetical protein